MTANIQLLRKVLEHVTDHPEEWNQGVWAVRNDCGTAACIAGHTVLMTGHQVEWVSMSGATEKAIAVSQGPTINRVAAHELGLTGYQADVLFNASNTLADLWWLAGQITDGEIATPGIGLAAIGRLDRQHGIAGERDIERTAGLADGALLHRGTAHLAIGQRANFERTALDRDRGGIDHLGPEADGLGVGHV